tara:strand:+ start:384 stop:809 length:426 start_codon:yes stop_codon:yes gene_type:complete
MTQAFLGIDHIGVAVKSLEDAMNTYGSILGFELQGCETLEDRGLEVCFVNTGKERIELIAPTREDSEVSSFLDKRGEGTHHICVRVANIDQALEEMIERGARIAGNGVQAGAHDTRVAFIHPKSTHGVLIELVEAKEEAAS